MALPAQPMAAGSVHRLAKRERRISMCTTLIGCAPRGKDAELGDPFLLPSPIMSGVSHLLALAAFFPELAGLRPHLSGLASLATPTPGAPTRLAHEEGELDGHIGATFVAARVVGVGLPAAAAGAGKHIGQLRPRAVLLIGTCGAYAGSGLGIGDVVVARRVRLVDPSVLEGHAQFPEPMRVACDADGPMAESIARATGAKPADIATTLGITVDDASAGRVARDTGAGVEHLEAYGVAVACATYGVPFGAILGVANVVGAGARQEWRLHHDEVEVCAAEAAVQWLRPV
jgi:nucleoside phosphorylase